jgi:hypothetical protein
MPGSFEQGFTVGILPMNRLPGSPRLRASAAILPFALVWITDDGRLERNGRSDASPNGRSGGIRYPHCSGPNITNIQAVRCGTRWRNWKGGLPLLMPLLGLRCAKYRRSSWINPDRPRIACRRLSKAGDDARPTQASPTREHVGGLFGPDCKRDEQVICPGDSCNNPERSARNEASFAGIRWRCVPDSNRRDTGLQSAAIAALPTHLEVSGRHPDEVKRASWSLRGFCG